MLSKFFIERPVLSNVIALVTMLLGTVAIINLPITQYPPITPPTVQVTAYYPGATAETLIKKVALPIEQQVNGVQGMLYMSSTSTSTGTYILTVTFQIGMDPDMAQILVENRVSAALAQLPSPVQTQGVVTKKTSTSVLQLITITSPTEKYDALFLNNYATISLQNELIRLPGVANINVLGIGQYSMRIWLNPDLMQQRSLVPEDVINALTQQNVELAAGQFGSPPAEQGQDFQLSITANGSLNKVSEFEEIIVKSSTSGGGKITRLKDVARVELGSQAYNQFFEANGKPAGGLAIYQLPGSNAINTAKGVRQKMEELAKDFPKDLAYDIPFDSTIIVKESVNEVYMTLFEAGILVLIVIVVFLQDWRASLVPATTVPVTIIGAFGAMALLGFTVNTMSLFAIVLSIGIVVDDAIVIVEGVVQHLEKGVTPHDAAIKAMNSLFGPIIGITLVLMSVFLPAAFMPGMIGQMYCQFALVIASTALISAINAMTLKPTQCALWLKKRDPKATLNVFFRAFNAIYHPLEKWYERAIGFLVSHSLQVTIIGLLLASLAGWGFTKIPTGFLPSEDQGYLMVISNLPKAIAQGRTKAVVKTMAEEIRKCEAVKSTLIVGGIPPFDSNDGIVYIILKDWGKRGPRGDLKMVYEDIKKIADSHLEARSTVIIPPPIQGLGFSEGFQMQVSLIDNSFNYEKLQKAVEKITARANKDPMLENVSSSFLANIPQRHLTIDRREAATYGVSVGDIFNSLQTYLGSTYVNQYNQYGHTFDVFAQADTSFRANPDTMKKFYVHGQTSSQKNGQTSGQTNSMVPLGSLVKIDHSFGPSTITLYDIYPSASIIGVPSHGTSSGQALEELQKIADEELISGAKTSWTAMSYQEKLAGASTYLVFGLALLLVYLVLAGQYESWITPVAVILAVPLALLGTVVALGGIGLANNIYVQIGLVLLIALSAKNAILVVEMAREYRAAGHAIIEAASMAAINRFRPILMTSITFIVGVMPLVFASGAGANARKSLGIAVASGMLASTCLAVVLVPSFFVVLERFAERKKNSVTPKHPD
ncbi:MAG: efflux RND transporter permease subunit [Verrucomicrobia bacterium]|nr:MAG: efflux RND transporter permease subunit [Verrucomicrobiota bacterium]